MGTHNNRLIKSFISIFLVVNMVISLFDVSIFVRAEDINNDNKITVIKNQKEIKNNSEISSDLDNLDEVDIKEKKILNVEEAVELIIEEQESDEFRKNADIVDDIVMFVMVAKESALLGNKLSNGSDFCKKYGLYDVEFITEVYNGKNEYLISYKTKTNKDIWDVIDKLNKREDILGAEPGYTYETTSEVNEIPTYNTAPYMQMQWYLDELGMLDNWEAMENNGYHPGKDVVVAVIDTGVLFTHEALKSAIWSNSLEIPGNGIDDDNNGYVDDYFGVNVINPAKSVYDDNGHGTNMSSIIAMQAVKGRSGAGIAYNAKIMPIKAADSKGEFNQDDVARGINYAVDMKADIINMSFGGEKSIVIEVCAQRAYNAGCILIAAAGNNGVPTSDGAKYFGGKYEEYDNYPAASPYVIGVMAHNQNNKLCSFSNWDYESDNDIEYDIIAPGSNMYTADNEDGKYIYSSGTSAATAVVSSIAANFRSIYKDKTKYKNTYIISKLKSNNYITYKDINGKIHKFRKVNADLKTVANTFGKYNLASCSIEIAATNYTYTGSEIKPIVVVKYGNTILSENTYYTVKYENNIAIGKGTIIINPNTTKAYGVKKVNININPPSIQNANISTLSKTELNLEWSKDVLHDGYDIYRYNNVEKKYKFIKRVAANKYKDVYLYSGVIYYYKIRAYKTVNNIKYYSGFTNTLIASTKLAKTAMTYSSDSSSKIKVAWYSVSGANGYELFKYNSSAKAYKKITTLSPNVRSYVDVNLLPLKKYYYVVRPYKKVNNNIMYGEYSDKIAAYTGPKIVEKLKLIPENNKKVLLSWNKVSNVTGYQIYYSSTKNGQYKKLSNLDAKYIKVRISSLPVNKIYYYKVRAYKKVNGKYVFGDFSSPVYGKPIT